MQARVGEKCPQGGIWYPQNDKSKERAIGINNVMPPTNTSSNTWVLKTPTGDR